ncbi:MAG: AtpZ/AtpI family protein [Candidatus Paceibacterota bacterium]
MNNKEKTTEIIPPWWRDGLVNFAKVSASIAIPIIIALYLGKYLDEKFGTTPWIFLGLTALAFIVSLVSIYISMVKYIKDLEKTEKSGKNKE